MKLNEALDKAPQGNPTIMEALVIASTKFRDYNNILCSISGGSDSDVLLDLCQQLDGAEKIDYVFFDTGLEFIATKEHIEFLKEKYGIDIKTCKAVKPIPTCCKEYGQPFLSKQVSEWMARLQQHGFNWEDEELSVLIDRYPGCKAALRWWCNDYPKTTAAESRFNINYNKGLKEFIINNPPEFRISNKCCTYAKKKVAEKAKKEKSYDLNMCGVRKAEGGARASAYKNCYTVKEAGCDEFRPIFWLKQEDKNQYEKHYNVQHSKCYTEYGMSRTGCAGCPFGRDFEEELEIMKKYEPKLYKAAINIFGDSYEYTRKYKNFVLDKIATY